MIQRTLFEEIKAHLSQKEMSLIVGPRQAGKTTLMIFLKDYLEKKGERTLYLSLDFEVDQRFFLSQTDLINKIKLEIGESKGYIFIDEIQRKENAGLFLKGLYDMGFPYKFIVSGSGSLDLKEKIHESLVGRKRVFELSTLSFEEFVNFKTDYRYKKRLSEFFTIEKDKLKGFLVEYLNFGGYPRVVLENELKEKMKIIDEIYRSVLEKDIYYLLRIEKTEAFGNLVRILAGQIGRLINYSELSSTLGISLKSVKNYLMYAEKTFIVKRVTPYFKNIRKEISKSPVIYFYDMGLRNYSLGLLGNVTIPSDLGFLFQNLILNILKEKLRFSIGKIHFWRTKDRAEVDFIVDLGRSIIPVEVKFKELRRCEVGRPLKNFILRYNPEQAWVINLGFRDEIEIENTKIKFLSFGTFRDQPLTLDKRIQEGGLYPA